MASKGNHAKRSKRSSHDSRGFAAFKNDTTRKSYAKAVSTNQRRMNNGRRKTGTD